MTRLVAAAISVALLVAAVAAVLWVVITAAAIYGAFWLGFKLWQICHNLAAARVHDRAELVARAEIQHRWYLAGDPRGIYGRYPPARVGLPDRG